MVWPLRFASQVTKPMEIASFPTLSYLITLVYAGNLIRCLLSFVSWVCIWPEWDSIQDKRGKRCMGFSNCFGTGMFYQRMSCMYKPIHVLIFWSHSMFYSRQNCLGRNTSGHEVSHSHSCCTKSAFQYTICLVIVKLLKFIWARWMCTLVWFTLIKEFSGTEAVWFGLLSQDPNIKCEE